MRLVEIPDEDFYDYRLSVIFDGYKWDLQAGEQSTISNKVILLDKEELAFLAQSAEGLYRETVVMEQALLQRPDLILHTGISTAMCRALRGCDYNPARHVRFMRFDFHPTTEGFKVSEVNSDVPAGYPEASVLPRLAARYFPGYTPSVCFGEVMAERLALHLPPEGTVAFLHDTHTVEDYQILRYLGDQMNRKGYKTVYLDPMHKTTADAILRHYPMEWMEQRKDVDWQGFVNQSIPMANHPVALLAQTKRLPLVWDDLNVDVPLWKQFLPETICPSGLCDLDGWILKPAFGRVGEGINIPGVVSDAENRDIIQAARAEPTQWVAQRLFKSVPVEGFHLGFGVFVVDGLFAGLFARVSKSPRMDSEAGEVPVLVGNFHM